MTSETARSDETGTVGALVMVSMIALCSEALVRLDANFPIRAAEFISPLIFDCCNFKRWYVLLLRAGIAGNGLEVIMERNFVSAVRLIVYISTMYVRSRNIFRLKESGG